MKDNNLETEQNNQGVSRREFMSRAALLGAGLAVSNLSWASSLDNSNSQNSPVVLNTGVDKIKTVLIINAHLTYPGMSEGTLNKSFVDVARQFFTANSCTVLETKIQDGYTVDEEVEKHLQADLVLLQTPVNWISTPWIYKKYVDDVFTSGLKSQKLLFGDGRKGPSSVKNQYGTGGKMTGKHFMICATWNAAATDFNDKSQYLYQGKSPADVFYNVTTNYRFSGFSILEGYNCFDVFRNKDIKGDLEKYPAHLKKVTNI